MHSSRIRTARSSSRWWGARPDPPQLPPLGVGLDLIPLNFPLGCGPGPDPLNFPLGCGPGPDPPQITPWVWAWRHPGAGTPLPEQAPPEADPQGAGTPPPVDRIIDACENITLPQLRCGR